MRNMECKELLDELHELNQILNQQSKCSTESRQREIVETILSLVALLACSNRTLLCFIIGLELGYIISFFL